MMKGISLFMLILSLSGHTKTMELKKNTRSIFIVEKNGWVLGKDLFGMPFIYFSPQQNGQRSNISFTDTEAEIELDIKSLASSQKSYQDGRRKWAKQVGASPLKFLPYQVTTNSHGHKIHRIGFNYSHESRTYHEKSYYIECRGRIIFSKALRLSENEAHDKDFNDLISSLDCGGL